MTTSSSTSRPSPPGGLRPALTPTPGAAPEQRAGALLQEIHNFRSLRFQGIADALLGKSGSGVSINLEYLIQIGAAAELVLDHGWSASDIDLECGEFDAVGIGVDNQAGQGLWPCP